LLHQLFTGRTPLFLTTNQQRGSSEGNMMGRVLYASRAEAQKPTRPEHSYLVFDTPLKSASLHKYFNVRRLSSAPPRGEHRQMFYVVLRDAYIHHRQSTTRHFLRHRRTAL